MTTQDIPAAQPMSGRTPTPGSIFVAFEEPLRQEKAVLVKRNLSQRLDATLSTLAMFGLLSPLVLASVMFVVTSRL
jgi:hypothetical protein